MMHLWQNKKKSRKQILHTKRKWYVIFGTVYSCSVLMHVLKVDLSFLFACLKYLNWIYKDLFRY